MQKIANDDKIRKPSNSKIKSQSRSEKLFQNVKTCQITILINSVKFGYSEKATKF